MIPDLPTTYVDHLVEPNGIGDVGDPNAAGEVGSMVGGLGVRMTLSYRTTENGEAVLDDVRGRAFGSAAPIPAISWLSQVTRGQTWDEACRHTPGSVMDALSDGQGPHALPPTVYRGAEFAVQALRRALGVAHNGTPADLTGQGILVCRCIGIGDRMIRRAIIGGACTPEAIGEACRANTGCRSCRPDLLALIDEEMRPVLPPPPAELHAVERITMARAGPLLRGLGLPLEGARIRDGRVELFFGIAREDASVSPVGAVALTRHLLRETVHRDLEVGAIG